MIGARAETRAPRSLTSRATQEAAARARAFFERPAAERTQAVFVFDERPLAEPDVRSSLAATCTGKCAYCEVALSEKAMLVDRFRPAAEALALDGSLSPEHYWWLAYAWENLYPSCAECQSFKGTRFPVCDSRASPDRPASRCATSGRSFSTRVTTIPSSTSSTPMTVTSPRPPRRARRRSRFSGSTG